MAPPLLVIFDLDFTIWYPEMYELEGAPFRKCKKSGNVMDRAGEIVHVFPELQKIWTDIHTRFPTMEIAVASKTSYPKWAKQCMELLSMEPLAKTLYTGVHYRAIYPKTKRHHMVQLQAESGISYTEMLFFDNDHYNFHDVENLGVTCVHCPDGMTWKKWEKGMQVYQEKQQAEQE